jgi:hypothetical protein
MDTARRPYLTTGIALLGASVIAVAPVTVPPQELPSIEVSAVDALRSVTADVELTASWVDLIAAVPEAAALILQAALQPLPLPVELESLAIALVKAGGPAVTETVKLWTETLPTTAQSLIAAGKFAHLAVLAANTVYTGTLTPIAPFAVVLMEALPLPIGTQAGVLNEFLKLAIQTPFVAGTTVLTLLAQVIDDGLSPVAAFTGAIDALSTAVTSAVESIEKIVAALGGALPISALATPEDLEEAHTLAVATDMPAVNDTNFVMSTMNSFTQQGAADTVTVTVVPTPSQDTEDPNTPLVNTEPDAESTAEDQSDEESQDSAGDDVMSNGATDLSDGNMAQPGTTNDESADEDNDGATNATDDVTAVAGTSGDQTATTNDSSTGSDDGSGDNGESSGE